MVKYTLSEVAKHTTKDDCWFVIHGKVYNVSKFGDEHPGGFEILLEEAGKDATNAFADIGHSEDAHKMLDDFYVGDLEIEHVAPNPASSFVAPANVVTPTPTTPTKATPPPSTDDKANNPLSSTWVQLAIVAIPVALISFFAYQKYIK